MPAAVTVVVAAAEDKPVLPIYNKRSLPKIQTSFCLRIYYNLVMKKIYSLLLAVFFLPALGIVSGAQTYDTSANDPEKIYLFDSDITVHTDGSITVVENITLNVKHQNINRGIYRDIPVSRTEKVLPVSLQFDGQEHPFFVEKNNSILTINFGDDNYIPVGKHTYTFTYTFIGAVDSYKDYDELYWNVTGNNWAFSMDKARVHVTFPEQVKVQKDGISLYTGPKGGKANHTEEVGKLTYETTRPLSPREGMTIAIPFDKGVVSILSANMLADKFRAERIFWFRLLRAPLRIAIILGVFLICFMAITWWTKGRDPFYTLVPQYEPPREFSPAFIYYLEHLRINTAMHTCSLLHLALNGYIKITPLDRNKTKLTRLRQDTDGLPVEEKIVLKQLFPKDTETRTLAPYSAEDIFHHIDTKTDDEFQKMAEPFINQNTPYVKTVFRLLCLLGLLPGLAGILGAVTLIYNPGVWEMFNDTGVFISSIDEGNITLLILPFIGAIFLSLFNIVLATMPKQIQPKWGILPMLFPTQLFAAILIAMQNTRYSIFCQLIFVSIVLLFSLYTYLIRNVTQQGQQLYTELYGFKHYLRVAETYRTLASNPQNAETIFCNFLPYAFALGLKNQWIKNFKGILSQAVLERCTEAAGGTHFITSDLSRAVSSASSSRPSESSRSSGGGGSHGGGSSGGGHGGGGGGGR